MFGIVQTKKKIQVYNHKTDVWEQLFYERLPFDVIFLCHCVVKYDDRHKYPMYYNLSNNKDHLFGRLTLGLVIQ